MERNVLTNFFCYGLAPTSQSKMLNDIEFGVLPNLGGAPIEIKACKHRNPKYVDIRKYCSRSKFPWS